MPKIRKPYKPQPEPEPAAAGSSGSINLKGRTAVQAVGGYLSVNYDEGGSSVAYRGVVVYIEATRMHVNFDRFDEAEGAWIGDEDEWGWLPRPKGGLPGAVPVAGAWRPGLSPGLVEKIFLSRLNDDGDRTELLVKWKGLAHVHCQWVPQEELEVDPANRQRVQRHLKVAAQLESAGGGEAETWDLGVDVGEGARTEEEPYNPDFEIPERVIAEESGADDLPPRFLVKWRSLPYALGLALWTRPWNLV